MEADINTQPSYRDYQKFWNTNLQKIEQMQQHVERSLHDLESNYVDFEQFYADIMSQIDILSSIYAGYNTLRGAEDVMRLKSLLNSYRKRYTREGMNFNLINRLLIKITDARNLSFENFPILSHEGPPVTIEEGAERDADHSFRKFKWITFERNRSWFIARFQNADIIKNENYPVLSFEEPDCATIDAGNRILVVKDIFARSPLHPDNPRYYILLDDASSNYAASRLGKRIYADHDLVTPMITPFKIVISSSLSPGRIRLFGKNHLLLY